MGWYGTNIGRHRLLLHDSCHDYVKQKKPLKYYEDYKLDLDLEIDGEIENISFPLLDFGKPKLIKKNYDFEWDVKLHEKLFNILQEREIKIKGQISVSYHHNSTWFEYFLNSELGNKDIVLTTYPQTQLFEIKKFKDLLWIEKNGLTFRQV